VNVARSLRAGEGRVKVDGNLRGPNRRPAEHPVVDRHLPILLVEELRSYGGLISLHRVACVDDSLAVVALEPGQIRTLEQIVEETNELIALCVRTILPVAPERSAG